MWISRHGPPLDQRFFFPQLDIQGEEIVRAIGATADDPRSPIYLTLMSAISHAQRDVDVRMVLPGYTDSWLIFHLGRSYYHRLISAGVKIYERCDTLMHAKTASIDGVWSTIGSSNMDWRSFLHNDEINAVILGHDFSTQMDAMFAGDLTASEIITLDGWHRRGLFNRLKERFARIGAYWL